MSSSFRINAEMLILALITLQAAEILPNLYRTVLIPPAVKAELAHTNTPAIVRAWISQPPQWLEVVSLKQPVSPFGTSPYSFTGSTMVRRPPLSAATVSHEKATRSAN